MKMEVATAIETRIGGYSIFVITIKMMKVAIAKIHGATITFFVMRMNQYVWSKGR